MQLLAQHELHGEQTKIYSFLAERIFSDLGFETADLSIHAAESRTITLCAFECDTPDNHTHSASFLACLEEAK